MLRASAERVERLLTGIGNFGKNAPGKGITRLAYTPEDCAAIKWLLEQVQDLHLEVKEDAVGNVFLRREGTDPTLPPVAMGSHLDTVIQGGLYDGVLGVVGALETLYMLGEEKWPRGVEVIIFRAEESSRFGYGTMGSKLLAGEITVDKLPVTARPGEVNFAQALKNCGYGDKDYITAVKKPGCYKCFLELHIEQGKVLCSSGEVIGIVNNIAAPTRFKIIIKGVADHSGATPMTMRKDALVAAAKLILAIQAAAYKETGHGTVGTVGIVDVEPGSPNVVPGKATLWVDVRGVEEESIKRTLENIKEEIVKVAGSDQVEITQELLTAESPVALSSELAKAFEELCKAKKLKYRHMHSGAGHDAMHMAKLVPTSMLFIPCKDGISHNPEEKAELEDICLGIEVLAAMVERQLKS